MSITLRNALPVTALCAILISGCGPAQEEVAASFAEGTDGVFGTLSDDLGDFTFRTGAGGEIESVEVTGSNNDGTITLPDGKNNVNFAITRDSGGELEFDAIGDQVLVAIRDDPDLSGFGLNDAQFSVSRDQLGPLADLASARVKRYSTGLECTPSRDFIDDTCVVIRTISVDDLANAIVAELVAQEITFVTRGMVLNFLNRYMDLMFDCCDSWGEYRDGGGDPCPAA
jgi:hypothetical protein